jgi:hypothetical protein
MDEADRGVEGNYANSLHVGFNSLEFVFDFSQNYPGEEPARLCVRVVTSPGYAKAFFRVIEESLQQYESMFRQIDEPEGQ